ncbi:phage tail protein [Bacillus toyonensis]|uniref:phage tail protein n=1 Tax=Bacillus toyonensis TaxID=155322 RepID=UPI000BF9BE07|nr:carbamoyl-phosphate synthase [Bacillus toyonensis]PGE68173.1 carbamoyl-phosphate synthase [Bacillus toyonensis]PHD44940.1 carbamoyl-phosphate synthase [Bacillus toyonensis]PRT14015.1 carbamoyl-phosphate synthase [Bacillus toyonensis]
MATQEELIVQFRAETDQIRREMAAMQSQLNDFVRTTNRTSREYRRSIENMGDANSEYSQRLRQLKAAQREAMRPHIEELKRTKLAYLDAAMGMATYSGSAQDLISQINAIGAAEKAANDAMMANDVAAQASILQTIGMMNNMSTTSSKLTANLQRMGNPLYNLSRGTLMATNVMERLANRSSAAQLALEFLGPNANAKQLNDQIRIINQSVMGMGQAFLVVGVSAVLFYGKLHKANMEMNPKYAEAYKNMMESLTKALQPMRDAFAALMIPIFNFVNAMAKMVIAFNEAHPTLAKFIQGTMMLVPALTLLLLPLGAGMGLLLGYRAAFAALWMIIKPAVLVLAMATPVAWALAAAITGLAVGFTYAYKNIEPFRNAINNALNTIKAFWKIISGNADAGNKLLKSIGFSNETIQAINNLVNQIKESLNSMKTSIIQAFHGDFSGITEVFKTIFPSILAILIGGIPGLVIGIGTMFARMTEATGVGGAQMVSKFGEILNNLVLGLTNFVTTQLSVFLEQGVKIITGIVQGITQALPQIVAAVLQIITTFITGITTLLPQIIAIGISLIQTIVNAIVTALPVIIEAAVQIINAFVQGITQMLPMIVQTAIQVITMFIQTIIPMIPMLIDAGIQILLSLVNGIIQMLPQLIEAAIQILTTLLNTIVQNLPLIIDAGIKVLNSLIEGIIQVLPQLIDAVMQIITKFTEVVIQNLPRIIESGMQILTKLIEGIIQVLPQIVDAVIKIIDKFTEIIVQNLPQIIDAGVQILTKLIDGIIQVLPQLVSAAIRLMAELIKAIIQHLPELLSAGKDLIGALIDGVLSLLGEVFSSGVEIGGQLLESLGDVDLFETGVNIVQGLIGGIGSMISSAVSAAKDLGSSIVSTVNRVLQVKSPSREMRDTGNYVGEGLIWGINQMENPVLRAAKNMAVTVKDAFDSLSEGISLGDVAMGAVSGPSIPMVSAGYKTPASISSVPSSVGQGNSKSIQTTNPQVDNANNSSRNIVIENVVMLDGYEIARSSQPYLDDMQAGKIQIKSYMQGGR